MLTLIILWGNCSHFTKKTGLVRSWSQLEVEFEGKPSDSRTHNIYVECYDRRNCNYSWLPQEASIKSVYNRGKNVLNELPNRYFCLNLEVSKPEFKRILKHAQLHHNGEGWDWNSDLLYIKAVDYSHYRNNHDFIHWERWKWVKETDKQALENYQIQWGLLDLY